MCVCVVTTSQAKINKQVKYSLNSGLQDLLGKNFKKKPVLLPKTALFFSFFTAPGCVTKFGNSFMMLLLTFLPSHPPKKSQTDKTSREGCKKQQNLFTYNYQNWARKKGGLKNGFEQEFLLSQFSIKLVPKQQIHYLYLQLVQKFLDFIHTTIYKQYFSNI